jgi:hypothetical protein
MAIKLSYDNRDDIETAYIGLYTERDGKWELTGVEGMKTTADVENVQEALRKERQDHRKAIDTLKTFRGVDPDKIHEDMDELTELRAMKSRFEKGGDDKTDEEIENLVAARVAKEKGPLERELNALKEEFDTTKGERDTFSNQITTSKLESQIRKAASEANVVPSAMDDIILNGVSGLELNDEGKAVTKDTGLDVSVWMTDMKPKRGHWWPASEGGGAEGGKGSGATGDNPWSKANWNLTKQGEVVKTQGQTVADQMAKQAGVTTPGVPPEK